MNEITKSALEKAIKVKARQVDSPVGREVLVIQEKHAGRIAQDLGLTLREVFKASLGLGICPQRYLRNQDGISLVEQLTLANSRIAVVGAGGLGGSVIQLLARIGIGTLVVIDFDVFDETNLNRQAFCTSEWIGLPKVTAVQVQLKSINPAVEVDAHGVRLDSVNAPGILTGCKVIVDALDNIKDRLELEALARSLGVPLVHGALAGFEGQVMTIFPEDPGLKQIYGTANENLPDGNRPERLMGVPSMTPSLVAALQAMEVIKILLNRGTLFRNKMGHIDLEQGEWNQFRFRRE